MPQGAARGRPHGRLSYGIWRATRSAPAANRHWLASTPTLRRARWLSPAARLGAGRPRQAARHAVDLADAGVGAFGPYRRRGAQFDHLEAGMCPVGQVTRVGPRPRQAASRSQAGRSSSSAHRGALPSPDVPVINWTTLIAAGIVPVESHPCNSHRGRVRRSGVSPSSAPAAPSRPSSANRAPTGNWSCDIGDAHAFHDEGRAQSTSHDAMVDVMVGPTGQADTQGFWGALLCCYGRCHVAA
jgi:hypothetical protein